MRLLIGATAVLLAIGGARAGQAQSYGFSFSGSNDSGTGTFLTGPSGTPGELDVTGITGTVDGESISLLAPDSYPNDEFPQNNNILYFPGTPSLDTAGVGFQLADGTDFDLYYDPEYSSYAVIEGADESFYTLDNFTLGSAVAATPEPSSLLLLGSGLLGVVGVLRRRRA